MQAAALVVEVVTAVAEELVDVAMEASTIVMDIEEIIILRGLTGGATESALQQSHPFKQANKQTTCNLARLHLIASRPCSTLPAVSLLKIQGNFKVTRRKEQSTAIFRNWFGDLNAIVWINCPPAYSHPKLHL